MLKPNLFNQSHFFKIKIKDSGLLNFSFFIINHFVYACRGREGRMKGMYQNVWLCIHKEGGQNFWLVAYVIVPNQKRVKNKLAELIKFSYLN